MGVRLAPVTLLAGIGTAVGTVAVYQWWWGLLLARCGDPAGPARHAARLGHPAAAGGRASSATVALMAVPRGEGDYLVASTRAGYAVLGLALVGAPRRHRDAAATRRRQQSATFRRKSACGVTDVPTVNM